MKPRVQCVLAGQCCSTAGAAITWYRVAGRQIAACRALVAMLAILLFNPAARRSWSWRVGRVGLARAAAGFLRRGETPGPLVLAGGAVILTATALRSQGATPVVAA